MDETAQNLASIGFLLLVLVGWVIWGIRETSAIKRRDRAREFDQIKQSVHFVGENLDRLDAEIGRIECRLEQHPDLRPWEVRTLRSNLAYNRRELARIASAADRAASGARG